MTARILAVEASSAACSAALAMDGSLRVRFEVAPRAHAARLLPMVEALLAEAGIGLAGLDALAFGRGPGSFTGLRIAAGLVQGLAFGADRPVVPVSSLAALAQAAEAQRVVAAFDARMAEVYLGAYRRGPDGLVQPLGEEQVAAPERVAVPAGGAGWVAVGEGWQAHGEALRARLEPALGAIQVLEVPRYPSAREIALLAVAGLARGEAVAAEKAIPVYLRDRVTHGRGGGATPDR
jgi:tRNA threonylcarbamoyladenosine biosynthesis protein TsaB